MPSVSGASSEVSIVTLWTFTLLKNTKTLCISTNATNIHQTTPYTQSLVNGIAPAVHRMYAPGWWI